MPEHLPKFDTALCGSLCGNGVGCVYGRRNGYDIASVTGLYNSDYPRGNEQDSVSK